MRHPRTCGCSSLAVVVSLCWFAGLCHLPLLFTTAETKQQNLFLVDGQVTDIQNGSFDSLLDLLHEDTASLVLFYAPWSGDSVKAAEEFSSASKEYHESGGDLISFVAINCWVGSCKGNLSADHFPLLVGYHGNYDAVTYHGEYSSWRMLQFVERLLRPVVYIGTAAEWRFLREKQQGLLVGHVDMDNPEHRVLFSICLALINRVNGPVCCAVTNEGMRMELGMTSVSDVILYRPLHARVLHFEETANNFNYSNVWHWMMGAHVNDVIELSPNATHLAEYRRHLTAGPVLILFHSKQQTYSGVTMATLPKFRRMAVVYRSCSCATKPEHKEDHEAREARSSSAPAQQATLSEQTQPTASDSPGAVCKTMVFGKRGTTCDVCQHFNQPLPCLDSISETNLKWLRRVMDPGVQSCLCLPMVSYSCRDTTTICCSTMGVKVAQGFLLGWLNQLTAMGQQLLDDSEDEKQNPIQLKFTVKGSDSAVVDDAVDDVYSRDDASMDFCPHVPPIEAASFGFEGLGCHTNKTVRFYTMDADRYARLILQLGVTLNPTTSMALAVVDLKNEAQFVLDDDVEISEDNIRDFVVNFTVGRLPRSFRSSSAAGLDCDGSAVCISEVTSKTFHNVVFKQNQDVLLLYFSASCGFCTALRSSYLEVAKAAENVTSLLVARINGDENDLPWQYTVSSYPTIVIYPAFGKHRSVTFSKSEELSPYNILQFSRRHAAFQTREKLNQILLGQTPNIYNY